LATTAPLLVSLEAASRGVLCLRPGAFEWVRSGRGGSQSEDRRFRVPWTLLLGLSGGARALPSPLEPASKSACWETGGGLKAASDSAKVRSRWLLRGGGAGEREACLLMLGDESPLSGPLKPQSASESHPSPASSPGAASSNERRALKGPKTKPVGEGEGSTAVSPSADGLLRLRAGAKLLSSGDAKVGSAKTCSSHWTLTWRNPLRDKIRKVGRGFSLADTQTGRYVRFTQDDGYVRGVVADAQALLRILP